MSGQPGRSAGTSLLVVAGALKTRSSDGQMDSICDRCDAGDIGGNAGAVVPGETSMPTGAGQSRARKESEQADGQG